MTDNNSELRDSERGLTRREGMKVVAVSALLGGLGAATFGVPASARAATAPTVSPPPRPTPAGLGARQVLRHQFGVNHTSINGPMLDSQTVVDFMTSDAPRITRFPAGDEINVWDWERGWVVDPLPDWQEYFRDKDTVYPATLERLKTLHDTTGVIPMFALNVATSTLDDQLAMLRHAAAVGLPVRYVELGNELYWGRYQVIFPTPQDYADLVATWSAAIKREFPAAQVAAVCNNVYAPFGSGGRYGTWNSVIAQTIHSSGTVDAVTMHPYIFSQYYPEITDLSEPNLDRLFATSLMSRESITQTLDTQIPDGIPVWITEFNFLDRTGYLHGRWAHGVYIASMMLSFLEEQRIEVSTYWAMLAGVVPTAHHHPRFAGDFVRRFGISPKPYGLTGAGVGLNATLNAMKGATGFQPIELSSQAIETDVNGVTRSYPAQVGYVFSGPAGRSAIVINRSARPVSIVTGIFGARGDGRWIQHYAAPAQVIADSDVDVTIVDSAIPNIATLQPYSINRFEIA